ncbi:IS30 family transposase, partial [Streptococcus agalactiae]|nr:IS30 family transposase [Streptococcus agalactiae]
GKTAYELFSFTYGKDIASILGIEEIPAEDVCQSPNLLKDHI